MGIFLAAVSIAFLTTRNFFITSTSAAMAIVACIIIIAYIAHELE